MHTSIPGVTNDGGLCVKSQAKAPLSVPTARNVLTSAVAAWLGLMALTLSCFAQTNPGPTAASGSDVIAVVLDQKIAAGERRHLSGIILRALFHRYADEHKLQPSDAELDAFTDGTRKAAERNQAELETQRDKLQTELKSSALSDREREDRAAQLASIEKALRAAVQVRKGEGVEGDTLRGAKRRLAMEWVRAWKINKALYAQYGGRVIFQQAGPEPLDAYREFLKEQERNGAFKITDPQCEADFWRYFTNDAMHVFYSKEEGEKFIDTPWWMMKEDLQTQAATTAQIHRSSLEKAIRNNLWRLSMAADQFFLEKGVDKVTLDQLVGPGKYLEQLRPVDGEDYSKLDLTRGATPWKIVSGGGITVTYNR